MKVIANSIRERGFRKWYERELVAGHGHLVLLVLATLALLGALEVYSDTHGEDRLVMAGTFALAGVVGVWSMRRYLFHLMRAETLANQAVCPACKTYARWQIEAEDPGSQDRPPALLVRCRDCGERWQINL